MTKKNKYSEPFCFKQFQIKQEFSAMKIGTDAVLLGAWCNVQNPKDILDIGTGTGIISLMLAQRFLSAEITALEIDEPAFQEAGINFSTANFSSRLSAIHASLQDFTSNRKYDLIVSNPPFFNDAIKSNSEQRNLARHTDSLSLADLCKHSLRLLNENGKIALVLPYDQENKIKSFFAESGFYTHRICRVRSTSKSEFHRILIEFLLDSPKAIEEELTIYNGEKNYTEAYKNLTADFYPQF